MAWLEEWGALGPRQRAGLLVGVVVLLLALAGGAVWLFRDPWVVFAGQLDGDQLTEASQQLDRAKLPYRIGDEGRSLWVPAADVGKARAALAAGPAGPPPDVGLELFKESDFSTTDFAQRINYQRALQGELSRTLSGVSGVKSVRVHVVLPEAGLFRREGARATAAINVLLRPGRTLGPAQVRGIQRLVAAAVPEIKAADVVVLDESGASLTRASADPEAEGASSSLELKRQVDQYLEVKLQRLLQDLLPDGGVSLAVDAEVDARRSSITTDEPLAASAPAGGDHPAGVLSRERQSQRGAMAQGSPAAGAAPDAAHPDSAEWENEYKVGRRLEQVLAAPGSIKRLSVAVALQGAPSSLTAPEVERLVAHAAGVVKGRGDAVDVLLLPRPPSDAAPAVSTSAGMRNPARESPITADAAKGPSRHVLDVLGLLLLGAGLLLLAVILRRRRTAAPSDGNVASGVEEVADRVRQWLAEGERHVRG